MPAGHRALVKAGEVLITVSLCVISGSLRRSFKQHVHVPHVKNTAIKERERVSVRGKDGEHDRERDTDSAREKEGNGVKRRKRERQSE